MHQNSFRNRGKKQLGDGLLRLWKWPYTENEIRTPFSKLHFRCDELYVETCKRTDYSLKKIQDADNYLQHLFVQRYSKVQNVKPQTKTWRRSKMAITKLKIAGNETNTFENLCRWLIFIEVSQVYWVAGKIEIRFLGL